MASRLKARRRTREEIAAASADRARARAAAQIAVAESLKVKLKAIAASKAARREVALAKLLAQAEAKREGALVVTRRVKERSATQKALAVQRAEREAAVVAARAAAKEFARAKVMAARIAAKSAKKTAIEDEKRLRSIRLRRSRGLYPSQERPQIPVVRLSESWAWLVDAIAEYRQAFSEENGVNIDSAQVVRRALDEVLNGAGAKSLTFEPMGRTGPVARIGPFRIVEPHMSLPKTITAAAKRWDVREADVIRGALAIWLTGKGYGAKSKRKAK